MDVVQKLSQKAEENDQLYVMYLQVVQQQGEEIRKLKQMKAEKMTKGDPLKGTSDHSETSVTASCLEDFDTSASSFWEMPIPTIPALMLRKHLR